MDKERMTPAGDVTLHDFALDRADANELQLIAAGCYLQAGVELSDSAFRGRVEALQNSARQRRSVVEDDAATDGLLEHAAEPCLDKRLQSPERFAQIVLDVVYEGMSPHIDGEPTLELDGQAERLARRLLDAPPAHWTPASVGNSTACAKHGDVATALMFDAALWRGHDSEVCKKALLQCRDADDRGALTVEAADKCARRLGVVALHLGLALDMNPAEAAVNLAFSAAVRTSRAAEQMGGVRKVLLRLAQGADEWREIRLQRVRVQEIQRAAERGRKSKRASPAP